jgi:hypothetical protein
MIILKSFLKGVFKYLGLLIVSYVAFSLLLGPYSYLDIPADLVWMREQGFTFWNIIRYFKVLLRLRVTHLSSVASEALKAPTGYFSL